MRFASIALVLLAAFISPPAWPQQAWTEQELQQVASRLAIDATKQSGGYRWGPGQFPLRVAFDAGQSLKTNLPECVEQWQRQYGNYVDFINAEGALLTRTSAASDLDVFVFFGSVVEHDALPAWQLLMAWWWKPGIFVEQWLDRYSQSYAVDYGIGQFIEFGAAFRDTDPERLNRCEPFDAAAKLGAVLLPGYNAFINAQAHRLFDGHLPATLEWRVHRRMLLAMRRLPEEALSSQLVKTFLIRELAND